MNEVTKDRIQQHLAEHRVMLYMKGTPTFPQCGFSGMTVQILDSYKVEYGTCNVLDDMEIRQAIKQFSEWPTIPQLYVDGQFVGGSDIVTELHESGELATMLKKEDGAK